MATERAGTATSEDNKGFNGIHRHNSDCENVFRPAQGSLPRIYKDAHSTGWASQVAAKLPYTITQSADASQISTAQAILHKKCPSSFHPIRAVWPTSNNQGVPCLAVVSPDAGLSRESAIRSAKRETSTITNVPSTTRKLPDIYLQSATIEIESQKRKATIAVAFSIWI